MIVILATFIRRPAADGTLATAQHMGAAVPQYPESDRVP